MPVPPAYFWGLRARKPWHLITPKAIIQLLHHMSRETKLPLIPSRIVILDHVFQTPSFQMEIAPGPNIMILTA